MPRTYIRPLFTAQKTKFVSQILIEEKINTICQSAKCPNRSECFSRGSVSFLALGEICTRECKFCAVKKNTAPMPVDESEPRRFINAVKKLNLSSVVITSVTRDDLSDGGARHLAKCIFEIKENCPNCKVELLIPDFNGDKKTLDIVLDSPLDCVSHNIETPKNLYPKIRNSSDFERSIRVLEYLKENCEITVKSGFMLGLGENNGEIFELIKTLAEIPVDILSVGQYFKPDKTAFCVQKYYEESEFENFAEYARNSGIKKVDSGVFVRTSYKNF